MDEKTAADDNDPEPGSEEVDAVAGTLRGDRWKTFLVLTSAGLIVATLLVGSMLKRILWYPGYDDSEEAIQSYLHREIIPTLEDKYSAGSGPGFECRDEDGVAARQSGTYDATVRCESSDKAVTLSVEITHDGDSAAWDYSIEETTSK